MRPTEDLTARARIRDAALAHFGEHGVKGASLRAIAERAGVSLGLVQHHFGSKEGLRDACDAHVVAYIKEQVERAVGEGGLEDPAYMQQAWAGSPPVVRYLGRALVDGSPAAAAIFDQLVKVTEENLHGGPDPRGRAAVFTAMRLGVYVLHEHLTRTLEADAFAPATMARIGAAMLDAVSPEFVGRDLVDRAREGLAGTREDGDG
ncbi:TetR/AcrR family transcriptional regulator [Nonomuraea sp. NPDC003214]